MPTLLSVNNYHYRRGGAEVVYLGHNQILREAGWKVVPFSMKHPRNESSEWGAHFVEELEFGGEYSFVGKMRRAMKVVYSFEALDKLGRLIDRIRPDICHVHNIYHHISPAILGLLRKRDIPVVQTLHDLKIACPAYTMFARGEVCERCKNGGLHNVVTNRCIKGSVSLSALVYVESALHRALGSYRDGVTCHVAPSQFYIEKLAEWGWDREKLVHVPNFVDDMRDAHERPLGRRFVYFGRMAHEKGLRTFVQAAARAKVPVALIGAGPEVASLKALASKMDVDAKFYPYLSGEELEEVVGCGRATVLPSEWYENAPMSVLESYRLKRPVIGARIGGIPELIRDNVTGATYSSGSVNELAATLTRFSQLDDREVLEMGKSGDEWVREHFGRQQYFERIYRVYDSILRERYAR